ncbi:MAG: NHL repeat-containing protein [Thermomicrobiales bacterium]
MTTLSEFDALRHRLALTGSRRPLLGGLAALPLMGAGALLLPEEDAAAKAKRKRNGAQAEKKKKKKLTLCLNGQTISAPKKKAKKLRKQGATAGQCATSTTSTTAAPCIPDSWNFVDDYGTLGSGLNQFFTPQGCALSSDGRTLWVADAQNGRIAVWTRPNASSTLWTNPVTFGTSGTGTTQLNNPVDVAVAPDEKTVWVADALNSRISIWTRESKSSTTWTHSANFGVAGNGQGEFSVPSGVSVAPDTLTVWTADLGHNRVLVWTRPDLNTPFAAVKEFGATGPNALNQPTGIVTSADTRTAWVVDPGNSRVSIWTRPDASGQNWINAGEFGGPGALPNQFNTPRYLAMDGGELTLWISDQSNDRVAVWTRATTSSTTWTFLATFGSSGAGNGQFAFPCGVAVSSDGATLLGIDASNNRFSMWAVDC